MITEADTCRRYVLPKLYSAGWNDDQINEQKTFTDGRIVVTGDKYIKPVEKFQMVFTEQAILSGSYLSNHVQMPWQGTFQTF